MSAECRALVLERICERGPMTVAEYMDLALYHPDHGYYARASRRTGRAGDFFTSVDVGPLFGELIAIQLAEMHRIIETGPGGANALTGFDLVEAGAGNGQLSRDMLDWASARDGAFYAALRLHLVERSPAARADQRRLLGPHLSKLTMSSDAMPERVQGVILCNELLDALPVHVVTMTDDGLREIYVDAAGTDLVERCLDPSTPDLAMYLERDGVVLGRGWRAEICLDAVRWTREAARRLDRGFLVIIDYGHPASVLYSPAHAAGTLATFSRHVSAEPVRHGAPQPYLVDTGDRDMTAHLNLSAIGRAAEDEGLTLLALLDQTYFLLGLAHRIGHGSGDGRPDERQRLALKTLMLPGGLGSTHKVSIFGKGVGRPALTGCSFGARLT
jgi:SAM-dependent MidA family methyltransferase